MKNLILLPIFSLLAYFANGQNDSLPSELPVFHLKIEELPRYCDTLDRAMIKPLLGVPATDLNYQKFPDSVVILGQRMPDLFFSKVDSLGEKEIVNFWTKDDFGTRGMPEYTDGKNWLDDYKQQIWQIYAEANKPIRRNLFAYYVNTNTRQVLALVFWQNGDAGFQIFDLKK